MSALQCILDTLEKEGPCRAERLFRLMPDISWNEFEGELLHLEYTDQITQGSSGKWIRLNA
jgi:hypothetical protein